MELLAPWALTGLVVVPAIFLWGLLAPRGRPVVVGSLMLWRRALSAGPAGKPSARVRLKNPLLWLDAGAVLLLVAACAQPALHTWAPLEPVATLVIDRTASMDVARTGDDGPRWRPTLAMVQPLLEPRGDVPVRVVWVPGGAGSVQAEETTASALMARGNEAWTPLLVQADVWPLAAAEAARDPARPVLVATDVAPASPVPANVYVQACGGRSASAGLVRVATRIDAGRWWLLVAARADADAVGPCTLVASAGGETLVSKDAFLTPGATAEAVFPISGPPPQALAVELVGPDGAALHDGFPPDNTARLALEPAGRLRVVLVGAPPAALRRAIEARGDADLVDGDPGAGLAPDQADVVVAYGAAVPTGWVGPAAVILPPATVGPVRPGEGQGPAEWRVAQDHPLAEALYLDAPRLGDAGRYSLDTPARLLLGTPEAPLMATWDEAGGRRLAVLFGLDEATTDWARRPGFPVFWSRAIEWLVPQEGRAAAHRTHMPFDPLPPGKGLAPSQVGFYEADGRPLGVSFIGTAEAFQAGAARDDSVAAAEALRASIAARCRASLADVWPYLAAAALAALVLRAWVAR